MLHGYFLHGHCDEGWVLVLVLVIKSCCQLFILGPVPLLLLLSSPSQSLVSLTPTHSLGTPSKPHNNGGGWDVLIRDGSWRKVANKQYDLS